MRCQASSIADLEIEDTQFNSWTMNSLRWNMATGKDISKFPIQKKTRFAQYFTKRFLMLDLMSWNLVIFLEIVIWMSFAKSSHIAHCKFHQWFVTRKVSLLETYLLKLKPTNFSFQLSKYWPSDYFTIYAILCSPRLHSTTNTFNPTYWFKSHF